MQMIVQGLWINDSQLKNIPHFTDLIVKTLHFEEGITYLSQLQAVFKKGELRKILQKYNFGLSEEDLKDIEECVEYIPDISFKTFVSAFDSEKFEKREDLPLKEDEEALVTINLKRENSKFPLLVQMERYNKMKDCGWWVVVANPQKNELLGIKKISFKDTLKKDLQIIPPSSFADSPKIDIHLFSDSYIGIDQVRSFYFNPKPKA